MPINSSRGGVAAKAYGFLAAALSTLTDLFNRTTSGSLGTASGGFSWTALRGTWYANGNAAQSDDAGSSYSIASAPLAQNVTVSAGVTNGTGLAFWVTDSNSWWASTSYASSTPGSPYTYACGSYSCFVFSASATCNGHPTSSGGNYNTSYISSCAQLQSSQFAGCTGFTCSGSTSTCTNYCSGTTATTYNYYLRLTNSVAGSITTSVVSDVGTSTPPAGIVVTTSGNTITSAAYSDAAYTTLLNSITTTPSSPVKGTGVGIIKGIADYSQGSTVSNFSAHA